MIFLLINSLALPTVKFITMKSILNYLFFLVVCFLLLSNFTSSLAQNTTEREFRFYLNKGSASPVHDSAMYYFGEAQRFASDSAQVQRLNYQISGHFFDLNQMDSAFFWIDKNLKDSIERHHSLGVAYGVARSYYLKRLYFSRQSRYSKAIKSSENAIFVLQNHEIEDAFLGICYLNLGIDNWRVNEFALAEYWLSQSLKLSEKVGDKRRRVKALISLGLVKSSQKQFEEAKSHYKFALELLKDNKRGPCYPINFV